MHQGEGEEKKKEGKGGEGPSATYDMSTSVLGGCGGKGKKRKKEGEGPELSEVSYVVGHDEWRGRKKGKSILFALRFAPFAMNRQIKGEEESAWSIFHSEGKKGKGSLNPKSNARRRALR